MQVSKWLMVVLTVCLLGGRAFSQSADDIINKNLDALGGKDKLATLTSLYSETSNQIMGQNLPAKTWVANGIGLRTEMEMMGSKMITVINKDKGWIVNPMSGGTDVTPLPDDAIKSYAKQMDLAGQFYNYAQKGYTATLLGNEKVDGKDAFKIKISKPGLPDVIYFVDAGTYYIDKTSMAISAGGQTIQTDIAYSGYKKTPEGFIVPVAYKMTLPQGELDVSVTKLVFNQPIDSALFQKP
jgi:outer membrane lipoprotein-sorting protein